MKAHTSHWLKAMQYSLTSNFILVGLVSFIISFTVFLNTNLGLYAALLEFIQMLFGLFFYVGIISLVITLLCSVILGTPTVYLLKLFNIARPIYAAIVGALSVTLFFIINNGELFGSQLIFSFFGFVCGYAFMYGYNKEEKS